MAHHYDEGPAEDGFHKINSRTRIVNIANNTIRAAIDHAITELTYAEVLFILAGIIHSYTSDAIKAERAG